MAVRMTESEYLRLTGNKKTLCRKSKYGARKKTINGISYDSNGEYERHYYLKMLEKNGDITNLRFHNKKDAIVLVESPSVKYFPDFCYEENGEHIVEDFKGVQTKEFIIKKKIIISMIEKGILPVVFRIVKDNNGYEIAEEYKYSERGSIDPLCCIDKVFNMKNLTADNVKQLWHSVGWVNGSALNPERLLNGIIKSDFIVCSWDNGNLVGLCSVIDDGSLNAWISYMVISPEYQRSGLGGRIISEVKEKYKGFRIFVQTHNADEFYKKNGFEEDMHSMVILPDSY